uniref:Uncharacterized protein n=1 Tax=Anguilla anguilla TaxID=7936 RepID=A0A0E9S768_ANGAN
METQTPIDKMCRNVKCGGIR